MPQPYIPVPDVVQVELIYMWDGVIVENVFHYSKGAALMPGDLEAFAPAMVAFWTTNWQAQMPTTVSLTRLRLTDMTASIAPALDYGTGLPLAGTDATAAMPNSVTICITKRTILRGRSYRGRIYHIGLTEARVIGNSVPSAQLAAIMSRYELMKTITVAGIPWSMGVVSKKFQGVWREVGDFTPVVGFTCDGIIDSQRRRLPGRGA